MVLGTDFCIALFSLDIYVILSFIAAIVVIYFCLLRRMKRIANAIIVQGSISIMAKVTTAHGGIAVRPRIAQAIANATPNITTALDPIRRRMVASRLFLSSKICAGFKLSNCKSSKDSAFKLFVEFKVLGSTFV